MSRVECMRRVLLTLHVFKCPCQQRQADNSALRGVFLREIIYATTP